MATLSSLLGSTYQSPPSVTSISGTGTVSGITLSGTVTSTGNLTLGGTLSAPISSINDSTTVGQNLVKLANPSAIRFLRINADNTVSALSDVDFRTAIGAGTGGGTGTVTSVSMTVPTGLSISGSPITTSGTLALTLTAGYSIPTTTSQTNWDTAYTDRLKWDGGSTGLTAATGRTSLGATTVGSNLFTLTNPTAVTFLRINADNTVSTLDAATFRTAIGAGTSSTTGTVTSVAVSAGTGITISGSPITTSGTITVTNSAPNITTDISITHNASDVVVNSSDGTDGTINAASTTTAGVMTSADKTKLDGIATGATANTGTVTSVSGTGTVAGLSLSGTVTTSGNITLGGTLSTPVSTINDSTTVGQNLVKLTNPSAITFLRVNADNTVSTLDAATFRTAIGAGTSSTTGTVTSVGGTGTVAGLSLSGTVTTSGNLTLSGTLSTPVSTINDSTTVGQNLVKLTNPSAITFLRVNADNTVSTLDAATFRTAIGAGTSSTTGTVTSVSGTGTVSGLSLSGTVTTSGNITLGGTLSVTPSDFASQTANTFLAAPNGIAGTPSFRAIVAADIPTLNQNTTGTASNVTGTVAVANGGTGATTLTANNVILGNGTSAVQFVAPGASGNVLTSNGTTWTSAAPTGGSGGGYSTTVGNGSATSFTVTHSLNKSNILVSVRENITNGYFVYPDIKYTSTNAIVVEFATAPTTNQYLVCVMGF